jgi:2',3'-cyclic-nucleotide 2'-phosphodiesterase
MKIMFIGDIVGEPGRKAVQRLVPVLIEKHQLDFVIANSENAAGGVGVTPSIVSDLLTSPVDVLTSGNHAWDKKEGIAIYDQEVNQLRPANYPTTQYFHTPGEGFGIFKSKLGVKIGVVNLIGCVFMNNYDCPFQAADAILEKMKGEVSMIFMLRQLLKKKPWHFF